MSNIVKKITIKSVCGETKAPADDKNHPLMTVFGLAKKCEPSTTQYGEYIKFSGAFEAVNLATGEVVVAGQMILPQVVESLIFNALDQENTEGVQFAFELGVKADKNPRGYIYTVKSLVEPSGSDPLADLRSKVALPSNVKKLENKKGAA